MNIEIMIATLIIAAILMPIIIVITITKLNNIIKDQKQQTYTASTTGTITTIKNKNTNTFLIKAKYKVDNEVYDIKQTLTIKNKSLKVNDEITIKYNPNFPSDASIEEIE